MWHELRILLPYLRRYAKAYVAGSAAVVLCIALKLFIPDLLGQAIDALRGLLDRQSHGRGASAVLVRIALSIFLLSVVVALVRTASRLWILGTSRSVAHDLRQELFRHISRLAPSFYVRNPTGQIMSRCVNDMQHVQGLMGPVILYLVETLVLYAIGLFMMLRIDWRLTVIGVAPFPLFLVAARRLAVSIQERSREAQNSLARVSAKVDESLSGQLVVKTLCLEDFDRQRFLDHCQEYRALNLLVTRDRAVLIPLMMALTAFCTLAVLAFGAPAVAGGRLSLGSLVAMMLYLQMLAGPTRTLGFVISSLRRGASALERIREILDSQVTIVDPPAAAREAMSPDPRGLAVSVRGLDVVYPPLSEQPHLSGSLPEDWSTAMGGRTVLRDIHLDVPAGGTLGIVGHTGAGKTTLVRALARQLEVPPGTVFIGGADVTRVPLNELRQAVGCVPQDAFLFSATLAENVALGRPEASRQDVLLALDRASLTSDLGQLARGVDTLVGERGVVLSGGQRQRAALARALLLDPPLLILDDTLSAVDTETAERILNELRSFGSRRTTIVVSHRLSAVAHADWIVLLEEGRIAEEGTHDRLLALGGRYAALYQSQQQRTHEGSLP
jgi:ATP-binding cassette subfamily B protein